METTGWHWERFESKGVPSHNFWLGSDRQGNRWLTKLRGDFKAFREIVFGRLAQQMGWSCQSSVFIRVDDESASMLGVKPGEVHAAHWFLDEHVEIPCNSECRLVPLVGRPVGAVEDIADIDIPHILDWPKSELAACLFGGTEPPGRLFTVEHDFVIIDSELMFASGPSDFDCTRWWGENAAPISSGFMMAEQVCSEFLALGHQSLKCALALPSEIEVNETWRIEPLLYESFAFAESFLKRARGAS